MKMEHTGYSETSEHKIQTPRNHQKERIQHSEHGESLKSRQILWFGEFPYTWVRVKALVFSFTAHRKFLKRFFLFSGREEGGQGELSPR
jgi:hypothetical protein